MSSLSTHIKNLFIILLVLQFIPPLITNLKRHYGELLTTKTQVAALNLNGIVTDSSFYTKHLQDFFKNPDIKAIVLKMESGGAAAGSAEAIAHEIALLKKEFPKPIITLCENMCTSGSFYIAAATDYIIAPPSALIGGIGTKIPYQFKLNNLLQALKIDYIPLSAGAYKDATDPFVKASPEHIEQLENVTKDSYQNFIEHIATHRQKVTLAESSQWAEGKIFTGRQAHALGLIDEVGSLGNVIKKIKEMALIEGEILWVEPAAEGGLLNRLLSSFNQPSELTSLQSVGIWLLNCITNTLFQ